MNTLAILTAINDASMLVTTLTPLVQQAVAEGRDVTDEELAQARARLDDKIGALDAAIEKARAAGA